MGGYFSNCYVTLFIRKHGTLNTLQNDTKLNFLHILQGKWNGGRAQTKSNTEFKVFYQMSKANIFY